MLSDYLDKNMMMGLAILNPIYFLCMMVGAMKTIQITAAVILGLLLGPIFYFLSPEWSILLGGCWWNYCIFYRRVKCQLV